MEGPTIGKKRIGFAIAVAGLVFILLYPYLNYAGAHQQAEEFLAQNSNITRTSYSLFRGDLKPDGDYEHLVLDNSTNKLVKEHLILELDGRDGRFVVETDDHGIVTRVLSRGYLGDFTLLPFWVIISSLMMMGGGALLAISQRRQLPDSGGQ